MTLKELLREHHISQKGLKLFLRGRLLGLNNKQLGKYMDCHDITVYNYVRAVRKFSKEDWSLVWSLDYYKEIFEKYGKIEEE